MPITYNTRDLEVRQLLLDRLILELLQSKHEKCPLLTKLLVSCQDLDVVPNRHVRDKRDVDGLVLQVIRSRYTSDSIRAALGPFLIDSLDQPFHTVVGRKLVQDKSPMVDDADVADMAFKRMALLLQNDIEARIGLVKSISEAKGIVVSASRAPNLSAIERESRLKDMAFQGVRLFLQPDFVAHDWRESALNRSWISV